jgi:hypothetical protein
MWKEEDIILAFACRVLGKVLLSLGLIKHHNMSTYAEA